MHIFIGTYTSEDSRGIYRCYFDTESGELSAPELAAETENPSYLCVDAAGAFLYAANEMGGDSGAVSAFSVTAEAELTFLNQQPAHGTSPCHVSLAGKLLLNANYGSGSVSAYPIQEGGSLDAASCVIQHAGSSVHRRQQGPHAHSIWLDPSGNFVLVADLGLDRVKVYRLDVEGQQLVDHSEAEIHAGAGPRHLAFSPDGTRVFVLNEIDSTISVLMWDAGEGALTVGETVSTLPEDFEGRRSCAAIRVSPCGRFVYASNRGHDSIFAGAVDAEKDSLEPLGWYGTQGKNPRDFAIVPGGNWLLAANQDTDNVAVFRIEDDGQLSPNGCEVRVSKPVCVCPYEA